MEEVGASITAYRYAGYRFSNMGRGFAQNLKV
jgi:hypothetical protein